MADKLYEQSEITGEGRNYFVDDVVIDLSQYGFDPVAVDGIWRTFAECYEEGRRVLHIHFRVGFTGREIPYDYCAVFNGLPEGLGSKEWGMRGREKRDGSGCENSQVGKPVLVLVRKLVKRPQEMPERFVPSFVRLRSLDECLSVGVNAPDLAATLPTAHGPVGKDRKLQRSRATFRQRVDTYVSNSKFVDEVIESGADVVQAVADDGGKPGRYGIKKFDGEKLLTALRIEIMDKAVRLSFEPASGFGFKILQVVKGSI